MKFNELCVYFEKIEETPSRLEMTRILADLFHKISIDEIDRVLYLLQGRLTPLYEQLDFGLGEKMIIRSLIISLSVDGELFTKKYKLIGDLGKTVENFKREQQSMFEQDMSVMQVFNALHQIATAQGIGSQDVKLTLLSELVQKLDALSCRYVIRIPTNTLRLGFSDMTILDAFSWMLTKDKSLRPEIEKAYHVRPDLGFIGKTLKSEGIKGIKHVKPQLFTPIIMMKAERMSNPTDILEKIGSGIIEPKYDGFRLQVHFSKKNGRVRLYSRGLEDVTYMYPDIVEGVKKEVVANEVIFEGEAIGFDPVTHSFLPFQETVQRKRKYGIDNKAKEIPLKLFVFELLYFDKTNYLHIPFQTRRGQLNKLINKKGVQKNNTLLLSPEQMSTTIDDIDKAFTEAVEKGLEGIMVKKLDGVYQPGARGWNWIKYKKSYSSKLSDTIDCLVMGYDYGKGKRTDFGIGAFLVGVLDEKRGEYVTIAKIGTGLTDSEWRELEKRAQIVKLPKKFARYDVDKMMEVDVWVKPSIVVEIRADEITRSPTHTAGRVLKRTKTGNALEVDVSGYALRFPRLERFRDDKRVEDITTLKEIVSIFKDQKH